MQKTNQFIQCKALLIVRQYALHLTCVKILIPNNMCLFNT